MGDDSEGSAWANAFTSGGGASTFADAAGHEHRGKGEGGGQFVKQGDGKGGGGEKDTPDEPTGQTPAETPPETPVKPTVESSIHRYKHLVASPEHDLAPIRAMRPELESLSKSDVAAVLAGAGYTPHGTKKGMIERLITNLEVLAMTKMRSETIRGGA